MRDGPIVIMVLLVGLAFLTGPIALVAWLLGRRDLREMQRRVEALEREMAGRPRGGAPAGAGTVAPAAPITPQSIAVGSAPPPVPGVMPPEAAPMATPARAAASASVPGMSARSAPRDIESILGGQWLTWLGILAIFFGTAFFLAYDLTGSPLAGTGQVLVGLVVAALFIVGGRTLAPRLGAFLARGLLGGGVGLLYLGAYAAHAFHGLVPAIIVYPFLLGVAVVGTMLALGENSLMVAALTQTGALLVPWFLAIERGQDPTPLFAYLAAVNLGAVLVARQRPWPLLPLLGFFGTVLLVTWWWARGYALDLRGITFLGVTVLWLLQALAPLTAQPAARGWGVARALVLVANGFLYEAALYDLLRPGYHPLRGVATALLALLYVVLARVYGTRLGSDEGAVRMTRLTGLGLAVLAIPIQFDLAAVTLGWSLLALVLLHGGFGRAGLGERLLAYLVLLLAVGHSLLWDTVAAFRDLSNYRPWLNGGFLVGLAAAGALAAAAWTISRHRAELTPIERRLVTPLVLLAGIVVLVRITVEVIAGYEIRETLTRGDLYLAMLLTLSLIWAVYAGALIAGGFAFKYRPIRFLGIAVLALLIFKVFLFDLQELDRGYRIASFVGVGLLLLMISILYQRERKTT
jgi:uncharacterized membrane protein